jgi:thioredoxin 1
MAETTAAPGVIKLTDAEFQTILTNNPLLVVDCYADWCAPCRMIAPFIQELATEYAGKVSFSKVDVDHNPKISVQFGIRSIPTLLFFKNGKLVDQVIGALPKHGLKQRVDALLAA